jgi:hypothetical protein
MHSETPQLIEKLTDTARWNIFSAKVDATVPIEISCPIVRFLLQFFTTFQQKSNLFASFVKLKQYWKKNQLYLQLLSPSNVLITGDIVSMLSPD